MKTTMWTGRGLVLAMMLSGCGAKKEIESLQQALTRSEEAVLTSQAEIQQLEAGADDLKTQIAKLETELEKARSDLAAMEKDLDDERALRAQVLADRGALRREVEAMKEAIDALEARKKQAEARVAAYRDLVARFQSLIDAGTLDVRIVDGRMVVVLSNDVLFDSGKAELRPEGQDTLTQVASVLADLGGRRLQVEGHTDDEPIATSKYPSNWYLASARAIHVVEHLVSQGVPADMVSAASFADTRPVAANDTPEGRAQNRRIEIVVVPDLSELPGYEELNEL